MGMSRLDGSDFGASVVDIVTIFESAQKGDARYSFMLPITQLSESWN